MKTGFTTCDNLSDSDRSKALSRYVTNFNYKYLNDLATQCGHPGIVKLKSPALDTCDGAYDRFDALSKACREPYSPATCNNTTCATAIIDIEDATVSLMKTGFTVCGNLTDSARKSSVVHANSVNYETV
jgi:hypothetical protein